MENFKYLVCLKSGLNVASLCLFDTVQEAKDFIEKRAYMVVENTNQCLSIYKISEKENVYDFYKPELLGAHEKNTMFKLSNTIGGPPLEPQIVASGSLSQVYITTENDPIPTTINKYR